MTEFRHMLYPLGFLFLVACSGPADDQQNAAGSTPPASGPDDRAIGLNNRGVGLMGRFEYEPARQAFASLVEQYPEWADVDVNLAIATLNRQEEGDEQAALARVDQVLKKEPDHLRAHYVAGLLRLYLSSPAEALVHFRRVAEADPEDAYAAYYLAQCLAQESQYQEALDWYRRAMALDPYLRSAYYGAFQSLRRLRQANEARAVIADYQKLANNPRARLAEFKYTRMGPKGEALAIASSEPRPSIPHPAGPLFAKPRVIARADTGEEPGGSRTSLTAADMQGDGALDILVTGVGGATPNLLLHGQPDGSYQVDAAHPLAAVPDVNAALWGDFDNDGLTDVYLCRAGTNQLWRQTEPGSWLDVTAATGTGGGERDTVDGVFFDADHDGDLDLFLVNADGPNELLNNNLDGSFRALGAEFGVAGDGRASRLAIPVDIDGDRDVDLVVVNGEPPHEVYLNDRLWQYTPAKGFRAFRDAPVHTALAADVDADGVPELYAVSPDGKIYRWSEPAADHSDAEPLLTLPGAGESPPGLAAMDVNGDGRLELIASAGNGWAVVDADAGRSRAHHRAALGGRRLRGWSPVVVQPQAGPSVLGLAADGTLHLWGPGRGRHRFVSLVFTGAEDAGQSMRSNASGIGTRMALRVGDRWTLTDTLRSFAGPGQSLQPVAIGLGGAAKADFVAIDWSDGVFQSELDLGPDQVHRIAETQRQLSSCPVLFAWDGDRYAFVSDLLGVGGLGYAVGPGEYATPRPWENLLLPPGLLKPREGRMLVKLTEPMEEAVYIDAVRLVSYDLPPGWELVLDERMGIQRPPPTGEPRFFRHEILAMRATNDRGQDVTATVRDADGEAAPVGARDRRFVGRLEREHLLTLRFEEPLDQRPGQPLLVADGWVEYPYSQTMFAAWQAGAGYQAPSLEARGADGRWHRLLEQFGYPAGMPRRMSVPLDGLPAGTREIRLRTNQEIYWDRLAVAYAEPAPRIRREVLSLASARLAKTGFPLRLTRDQHRPDYDYGQRRPFWDTRYMAGLYTRLGDVKELVARHDDGVAVFGAGEEVHMAFAAPSAPAPQGWRRYFVLEANGWTKDMDLFTQHGETVGPLPNTGKPPGPRDALHARYNTRWLAGR